MIPSEDLIEQAQEQIERIERALAALRDQAFPVNPAPFHLMAEGYLADIQNLRARIEELTGTARAEDG
jgi:hypothetical protein